MTRLLLLLISHLHFSIYPALSSESRSPPVQDFILLKPQSEEKYSSNGFNESVASFGPSYGLLHATRNYITHDATICV